MAIFRVDARSSQFAGEFALDDPDRLTAEVIRQVKRQPPTKGTYPVRFFELATPMAETATGACVIELISDGDNDDASPKTRAELRSLGMRLSRAKNVTAVWFFGISPENRTYWRDVFSSLGQRLHLCSADQFTAEHAIQALPPD